MIQYQRRIIEWMQKELQKFSWQGEGDCARPKAENVIVLPFAMVQPAGNVREESADILRDLRPAVVLSPARLVNVEGTLNCEDDVLYTIVVQFFDRDQSTRPKPERIWTWLAWEQQVRQFFSESDFRGEIDTVMWSRVPSSQWIAKTGFEVSRSAVWAVPVVVRNREPRDAASRSGGINGEQV